HELLAAMINQGGRSDYDIVRDHWRTQFGGDFDQTWKQALHDGGVANSPLPPKTLALKGDWATSVQHAKGPAPGEDGDVFRLDPHVYDGRFANNSWLQETPKPINKIAWDNFAIVSQKTAHDLGLSPDAEPYKANAKMLRLSNEGRELAMPVWVQVGHPDNSVTVYLGYG